MICRGEGRRFTHPDETNTTSLLSRAQQPLTKSTKRQPISNKFTTPKTPQTIKPFSKFKPQINTQPKTPNSKKKGPRARAHRPLGRRLPRLHQRRVAPRVLCGRRGRDALPPRPADVPAGLLGCPRARLPDRPVSGAGERGGSFVTQIGRALKQVARAHSSQKAHEKAQKLRNQISTNQTQRTKLILNTHFNNLAQNQIQTNSKQFKTPNPKFKFKHIQKTFKNKPTTASSPSSPTRCC